MSIRIKKYQYVNILITFVWLLLVCIMLKHSAVVLFSMGILFCISVFYSAPEIISDCCVVINLGYILTLILSHWIILHKCIGIESFKITYYIILRGYCFMHYLNSL